MAWSLFACGWLLLCGGDTPAALGSAVRSGRSDYQDEARAARARATVTHLFQLADAVVAVRIETIDYRDTGGDGAMYADATILKSLRGALRAGETFRFGETAWAGPDYQSGEHHLLFLQHRQRDNYYRRAEWRTVDPDRRQDHFDPARLADLSLGSLERYLDDLLLLSARADSLVVTLSTGLAPREARREHELRLRITSGSPRSIQLWRDEVQVDLCWEGPQWGGYGARHGYRPLRWHLVRPANPVNLPPGGSVAASLTAPADLANVTRIQFATFQHWHARFPDSAWCGETTLRFEPPLAGPGEDNRPPSG